LPPAPPPKVGGFTLLEKVYDGSISAVYKARQDRLGRLVALKLLAEVPPPTDVILERFNRAAYVTAQVVHSNLPVLYESGTADGYHYAALEFVPGQSAQEMVYQRGRLSERRATRMGWQVARALAELHDKGIVHRNVKPKNILVDASGKVCLVGLGLAKCDAACFSRHLDARTIGTPHFMAPEMIRGNCTDPRSDLYSLGATLYTLVSGRPPFDQGAPAAVMARHLYESPPSLKRLQPELTPEFAELVEQLMVKDPARRLGSAREASERLELLAQRLVKERADGGPVPGPAPSPRRRGFMGPLAMLMGAALMALAAGAILCSVALWRITGSVEMQAPVAAPEADSVERKAFEELTQREAVFATQPQAGLDAWQDYLQRYPDAPPERRCLARMQVERLRERSNRSRRPVDNGRDLDF
jgi:serine/threonine-protein kinase